MGKLDDDGRAVKGMHGTTGSTGAGQPRTKGRARAKATGGKGGSDTDDPVPDVREHLTRDLARVRAKFGMDPPPGSPSLTKAWMSDAPVEEDEAEFVDSLADCLGAGLSLQDALTCWDTGDLASDESEITAPDDEPTVVIARAVPRRPTGGHRLLVR
jgi:hypothetical protein